MAFNNDGYELVKKAVDDDLLKYINTIIDLHEYVETNLNSKRNSEFPCNDEQIYNCFSWYGSYHSEALLLYLKPVIERVVAKNLVETYSYYRTYFFGSHLKPHRDRPSCQFSATVCLHKDTVSWPINFQKNDGTVASFDLYPGDMVVYKGMDYTHWRDPFKGQKQKQMFLHYVDAQGPYARSFKYDGRPFLALNPSKSMTINMPENFVDYIDYQRPPMPPTL